MKKIFIDPGHGGKDPGTTGNGLKEKDLCLAIALQLRDVLNQEYAGHTLSLSRTKDETVSLQKRTDMANQWGADYLVSIHINSGGGTGFESYIYNGNYTGKQQTDSLRGQMHKKIVKETGYKDRGKKEANFHVLRESAMDAVLTENGFIDHKGDAANLKKDAFINKIARGHAAGLAQALGLKGKGASHHTVQKGDTLWALARKYTTTVAQLIKLNPGLKPESLQIGEKIRVK